MKKNKLIIVILLISLFVNGQNHDGIPVSGAKPITRDSFIRDNQPTLTNSQKTIKSNESAKIVTATPTGGSPEVGVIAGQLSVSLSGAALYNIPILVPPGLNSVEPEISLQYNSQQGNGLAGYGWSIKGISTISRISSAKYLDGTIDAVDLDNLDRFALDGQRLVVKNGTTGIYGSNETIYETENFSNIKITSYGVGSNGGPAYFLIQYPDGSLAQYGSSTNSRSITDWSISYWENPQGVRINYNYIIDTNSQYISSITYGSIREVTPINTINFIYASGNQPETMYVGGLRIHRSKILSKIQVIGANSIGYKNYDLTYDQTPGLGYNRLVYLHEKNGDNSKSLNPTLFYYGASAETVSYNGTANSNLTVGNINYANSSNITGDFDADGKMDFVLYPTTGMDAKKKFWLFNDIQGATTNWGWDTPIGDFEELFSSSWLSWNNKLMPNQGISAIKKDTQVLGKVDFNTYSLLAYGIYLQYQKSVNFPLFEVEICNDSGYSCTTETQLMEVQKNYLSGDFNGDGLTDVIAIDKPIYSTYCYYDEWVGNCVSSYNLINFSQAYFVDLDRFKTSNFMNNAGNLNTPFLSTDKLLVADVNGDGKSDLLHFSGSSVKVYTLNDSNQLILIMSTVAANYNFSVNPILLGDYNGDGKTDFLVPNGYGNNYIKFLSNGILFERIDATYPVSYQKNDATYSYVIIPSDTNNDGKTDLTKVKSGKFSTYGNISLENYKNISGTFMFSASANTPNLAGIQAYPVPIFLTSDKSNMDLTVNFLSNNAVYNFKFNKDFGIDRLLKKITIGNGNEESIDYAPLKLKSCVPYCSGLPFYKDSGYTENYPNYDIILSPIFQLVSNIYKNGLQQDYGYYGAVTNLQGMGFLGFRGIAKTNFYNSSIPVLTTFSHYSTLLRGAMTDEYTILGTASQLDYNPTDFISKTTFSYNTLDNVNFTPFLVGNVFNLRNTITEKINGLDTTSILSSTVFDAFNNPKTITETTKEGSNSKKTEINEFIYDDVPNATTDYHIGRMLNRKNISTLLSNSNTMKSEVQFTYGTGTNVGLVTQMKSFVDDDNTKTIIEDYQYDVYGNTTQKTIIATGLQPRTLKSEFSSLYSGRFLTKMTDVENLSTEFTYNATSGVLLSEKSPFSSPATPMINTFSYDSWFKKINENFYDGKIVTYSYLISGSDYIFTQTGNDGSESKLINDFRGRTYKKGYKNINGSWTYQQTDFDDINRPIKEYEPFFTNLGLFSEVKYDAYGRVYQTISATTKTTNITYTGLTTLVDDGIKAVTTIKNATGTVASITDPDGTITYDYFANNNIKKTTTDAAEIEIEQDGWGRKTKLKDPSAGEFRYEYNNLGETTKLITPKGVTSYDLNNLGKLNFSTIIGLNGDPTNSKTTYTYNSETLLSAARFDDFAANYFTLYSYGYDGLKRVNFKEESGILAEFQQSIQYDALGRPEKESYSAHNTAKNKSSNRWIRHTYINGFHSQIIDDASNPGSTSQVLWQNNTVNEKGQITNANFGNGIVVTNTYDLYGFPTEFKYDKTTTPLSNVMTLNTSFNNITGNLTNRSNSMFSWNESFQYDNLDRLKEFTNSSGQQETQNYDSKARISDNKLGVYNYKKSTNIYQNTSVTLSPEAQAYYNIREGIFFDTMENKKGWAFAPGAVTYDDTFSNIANGGSVSLKINNPATTEYVVHSETWIPINNAVATEYTYSGWVHSNGPQAEIFLFMKTENETGYYTQVDQVVTNVTNDWTYVTKTVLVPASIKKLNIRLDNNGQGIVWFDNVKIRMNANPIVNVPNKTLDISYNAFKSPIEILELGSDRINFEYNIDNNRATMYYGGLQTDKNLRPMRKSYSADGTMEIKHNIQTDELEFVTYIGGDGYSAPIILKSDGITQNYFYLHRDYLGSILAITSSTGAVVEKRLFDAWGNIVKVQDGAGITLSKLNFLDRGYTGHEHLQGVNLIHMNGRLYDPVVHRFLQPDNNIQDPYNTQNYNRYSYVLNNPLKYTDPSGEAGIDGTGKGPGIENGGLSNEQQTTLGSLIATIATNWDSWGIKDWANKNISLKNIGNTAKSVGKFVERNVKSVGNWVNGWFGHKSRETAPISIPQYQVNGPSPNVGNIGTNNYFGGGNVAISQVNGSEVSRFSADRGNKQNEFYGAKVRIISDLFGGGSYFAGAINLPQYMWDGYKKRGLYSYEGRFLMHEYGHFLQNKYGGAAWYNIYPAISSGVNSAFSNQVEHSQHWAEIQASTMAYYYFGFPKYFIEENNPINHDFISLKLRKKLYNQYLKE